MLDRLADREAVVRSRTAGDRRAVLVGVTESGLALLERLAGPLRGCHERQLGRLAPSALVQLLRKARAPHEPKDSPWN